MSCGSAPSADRVRAVVDALERAPDLLLPLIEEVPRERLKWRPAEGRWSAHEHFCHLATVHPLFVERLDRMLAEDHPAIEPYFPSRDEEEGELLAMDLGRAKERFVDHRRRLVSRLRDLGPEAWARGADHAEYSHYDVYIMFRHLALHDGFHAYRIEELLLWRSGS